MKILHLIHSLDYGGDARRLSLLAPALAANGSHVEICCLGGETPWAASLRAAGVPVHILGWTRWLDFSVFWNLRELLNDRCADVIHVWGLPALRALAIVAKRFLSRAVICEPLAGERKWYDGQLLKQVRVMPFVAITQNRGPSSLKNSNGDFVLTSVGRLEREDGMRQAIWAFDFLLYVFPHARLTLVGAGSQRSALGELSNGMGNTGHLQFLDACDADDALRASDVVWLPRLADGGRQTALDALALGKPVIASDVPSLRAIIRDGVTGYLTPPGDVLQLARRTKTLLDDADLRARIGAAARSDAQGRFSLDSGVRRLIEYYGRAAG